MGLLQMSFSGAVFILAIVVMRAFAINKLPKKTFLVLWDIALLRLLVPFSIPSMFSVYSFVNRSTDVRTFEEAQIGNIIPMIPRGQFGAMEEMPTEYLPSVSVWFVAWCIGMALCIMFFSITYLYWHFQFQTSPSVHNSYIEQWLKAHKLKRPLCVKQSDRVSAPLTYGIFRPVIIMPKETEWENIRQIQYILLHEYVHICRYDTVVKLISALALCIHWFNPFVWAMYILINRDIELSCDECVVRKLGLSEKSTYANMLISMEAKKSGIMPFCNNFNKNAIEERIEAIMRMKKTTVTSFVLTALLVIGTTVAFATSAQAKNNLSIEEQDRMLDAQNAVVGTVAEEATMMSYIDPRDGKTYYSVDGGETFEPLTDEEFEQRYYPAPDVEWWTYDEYKEWLENEKVVLQDMVGEICWTGGQGEFVWTQEKTDETIKMYEDILEDIKNGMLYSRTVDGDADSYLLVVDPMDIEMGTSSRQLSLCIVLSDGEEVIFGPFVTEDELLAEIEPFCKEQVVNGKMTQGEADEIIGKYRKIY